MKETIRSWFLKGVYRVGIVAVALFIAAASAVYAKANANDSADNPVRVVAHIQLSGGSVTRMLLVKEAGKQYLLLGLDSSSNVAIVDVSKPARARVIETSAGAMRAPAAETKLVAGALTEFRTLEAEHAISSGSKEIDGFSGVTSSIKGEHGLIYLANSDGLWIVKATKQRSESEFNADPDANYDGGGD